MEFLNCYRKCSKAYKLPDNKGATNRNYSYDAVFNRKVLDVDEKLRAALDGAASAGFTIYRYCSDDATVHKEPISNTVHDSITIDEYK